MKQKIKIIIPVLICLLFFANFSQAALVNCGGYGPNGQPQKACQLTDLVIVMVRLINFFLGMAWLVAMFFIFWAGYNMLSSSGNEEKLTAAKGTFRSAVVGFFLVMASYLLVNFAVQAFTGFKYDLKSILDFLPKP